MSDSVHKEDLGESFRQSRKELWFMLATWVVFLVWTLSYNAMYAFDAEASGSDPILGMPRWVFFGILVPWMVGLGLTFWFASCFMKDTQLMDVEGEQSQSSDKSAKEEEAP